MNLRGLCMRLQLAVREVLSVWEAHGRNPELIR